VTNPATLLANILSRWDVPPNQGAGGVRGDVKAMSKEFWEEHARAAALLREVEREICALESAGTDVSDLRRALPHWYRAVFAVTTPWSTTNNGHRSVMPEAHFVALRMLGRMLEYGEVTSPLEAAEVTQIGEALAEARQLVEQSVDLKKTMRGYLLTLIDEAERCLVDIEIYGESQVRKVTFEVGGAIMSYATAAAEAGDKEKADRWAAIALRLVSRHSATTTLAIGASVAADAITRAIT
jgi:hypothetical protein